VHAGRQVDVRHAPVGLQERKDLAVNGIEIEHHHAWLNSNETWLRR
jgi:hypothetical protein